MALARTPVVGAVLAFAGRLRFPVLFLLTAGLFALDVVVPDAVPFADEILLGLATLVLARWKKSRDEPEEPERS